jgi:hypothetical protein
MRGLGSIRRWGAGQWSAVAGIVASLATVAALFLPGDGDDGAAEPDPAIAKPKAAVRETLQHFHAARFDAIWEGLHPVDQEAVSRKEYVSCQESAGPPVKLLSLRLQDPVPYPKRVRPTIPAGDVRVVDGRERTLITINGKDREDTGTVSVFVAKDGDDWKVLLHPREYADFQRDKCPYLREEYLEGQPEPDPSNQEFSTPEGYE